MILNKKVTKKSEKKTVKKIGSIHTQSFAPELSINLGYGKRYQMNAMAIALVW